MNQEVAKGTATAEVQIATADEQLDEMQAQITNNDLQIEAMEDEIKKKRRENASLERKMAKLSARREVFIDAVSALRKLERMR